MQTAVPTTHSIYTRFFLCVAPSTADRPVRMHMDLDTNMKMLGKRYPYLATYQVYTHMQISCVVFLSAGFILPFLVLFQIGSTKQGVVNGIDVKMYTDAGWEPNDHAIPIAITHIDNGMCISSIFDV